MSLMDIHTRPRSLEELAKDMGVTYEFARRMRRGRFWPFELTPQGFILLRGNIPAHVKMLAIVTESGNQEKIDEARALLAARELAQSSV